VIGAGSHLPSYNVKAVSYHSVYSVHTVSAELTDLGTKSTISSTKQRHECISTLLDVRQASRVSFPIHPSEPRLLSFPSTHYLSNKALLPFGV
jgi:hypothetical protein